MSVRVVSPTHVCTDRYGKTGFELYGTSSINVANLTVSRAAPVNQAVLPFMITEHAAHTTADWNTIGTTCDTYFEASRLASQLLYMTQNGWETYIFKFSAADQSDNITPNCQFNSTTAPCGVQKVGLHWAENSFANFPIGDSTLSAEAWPDPHFYLSQSVIAAQIESP